MNEVSTEILPRRVEIKLTETQERNFWSKVNKDGPTMPHMESSCWVWAAGKVCGYGRLMVMSKLILAHRLAWMIANGSIPHDGSRHGICVLHRCDNPACVRIDHLFIGTNADNVRDMEQKGRKVVARGSDHGLRKHPERAPRGEVNGKAKLTTAQVLDIRSIYSTDRISTASIGVRFGVSEETVRRIIIRESWKHI